MPRRLPAHAIDPGSGTDGQTLVVSGGKFVVSDLPAGAASDLATWLVPLVTTNGNGDFDFVWSEEGELIYMEVPL